MFGIMFCFLFGIHDWKLLKRNKENGNSTILFLCPRCKAHKFFNIVWEYKTEDLSDNKDSKSIVEY